MSRWLTFITDTKDLIPILTRIADALDRIAPLPEEAVSLKPEEAVTYTDEEAIAKQEEIDELGADAKRISEWLREHPEFSEEEEPNAIP
jgi:hypothetical protein